MNTKNLNMPLQAIKTTQEQPQQTLKQPVSSRGAPPKPTKHDHGMEYFKVKKELQVQEQIAGFKVLNITPTTLVAQGLKKKDAAGIKIKGKSQDASIELTPTPTAAAGAVAKMPNNKDL